MAEHKLKFGIEIIDRLFALGQILEYHCEKEYPVDAENNSAVDVAWLYEQGQQYPLFIFEIESKTTNAIPANPLKVFGENNQTFEKPLFLFHLLLSGGQESGKIQQLERIFGTYNYRIYRFSLDEETTLVKDILSQHRRLTNRLQVIPFIAGIKERWDEIDLSTIICHIEDLGFEKGTGIITPSYAQLSLVYPELKEHFLRRLAINATKETTLYEAEAYDTYLGNTWFVPIHLGILAAVAQDNNRFEYFTKFKIWQEESTYIKQIGPSFGLSRDYDLFILGMSGAFFGLLFVLFSKVEQAKVYIADQLFEIVKKSDHYDWEQQIFNALWLIHISSNIHNGKEMFEYARNLINSGGGIPEAIYNSPEINYCGFIEGEENLDDYGKKVMIPEWLDFKLQKSTVSVNPNILYQLSVNSLVSEHDLWNPISAGQL
ncbi:hypothetical protein [Pedobacter suwonensis]|uniref:hypothetical protein n=1 Tax=Pedobacter suwonensis TaxID=332999 RepID=UPI0036C6F134